ncbi:hypothetical protein Pyrde_1345 [Pyrodictium delaneyi]|uniref:CRISPR-associated protein n=1 Tax=Pyrodictium delaneyi TaxID=1273541 RepID=A0A0P0N372_9CREN|nr:hypothetical protein [Pyrodictium delaneyi]ALL01391.1 hypothetical protein Pyrde_1345 [Pyrodictium delaneyi]OWJ54510.1 hypothetical protein Pdsh_06855 [Pyrodictium delaneyi]
MPRLVALIGASPGVLHTTLCLLRRKGIQVDEVVVVATRHEWGTEAIEIARSCPCPGEEAPPAPPATRLLLLPSTDITGPQDITQLRKTLSRLLGPDTILDVTGGRKLMSIAAALEALRKGATITASIIPIHEYDRIRRATKPCDKTIQNPSTAHLTRL